MARKSLIARNNKRIKLNEKYAKKRAEMKKAVITKVCKNYQEILLQHELKIGVRLLVGREGICESLVFRESHLERRQTKEIYLV